LNIISEKIFIVEDYKDIMAKVSVNQDTCIGCCLCTDLSPETFVMGEMKAKPINEEISDVKECDKEAKDSCPVDAIDIV
jgi:ferredoxin